MDAGWGVGGGAGGGWIDFIFYFMVQGWRIHQTVHQTEPESWVMGILNVTPDSFSDGGEHWVVERALEHAGEMIGQGAGIIDVGGESTRPGASPVALEEELRRVIPVIRRLRAESDVLISIDTMKAEVARAAIDAGADIINDVTGLTGDPEMLPLAARTDVGLIVMHIQGRPASMQVAPRYDDVVKTVREFFVERLQTLRSHGVDPQRVVLDPGFGFGKLLEHNLQLMAGLESLRVEGRPLLVGISRKSMLSALTGTVGLESRFWPSVALTSHLREQGATVHRVHDVLPNVQALRMVEAIRSAGVG